MTFGKLPVLIGASVSWGLFVLSLLGFLAYGYVENAPDPAATPFRPTDIENSQSLLTKLKQGQQRVSKCLYRLFSPAFQQKLGSYDAVSNPPDPLKRALIYELNAIVLRDVSLYNKDCFKDVHLSNDTHKLVRQILAGDDLILLNRTLLIEAYPEVARNWLEALVRNFNATMGGFNSALTFVISVFSGLFTIGFNLVLETKTRIEQLVHDNSKQLQQATAFGTIASLYPPLAMNENLEALFREHTGGASYESHGNGKFVISHSNRHDHITVHSEVLYYSILCSLLDSFKEKISSLCRSHIFLPNSPSALFLPDIIKITRSIPIHHRFYFFRNNVLDYNRDLLRERVDENNIPLLSTFAKASRLLFSDPNSHFGFLEAVGDKNIWDGRVREFPDTYRTSCERFSFHLQEANTHICGYVNRNSDTLKFLEGFIILGEDSDTKRFFEELPNAPRTNEWRIANSWDKYPIEVALVSGEEMEANAQPGVVLRAVDDYNFDEDKVNKKGSGWLERGDPRNIVWLKSVAAALREATVHRLFLVPASLITSSEGEKHINEIIELFQTMALQYHFLSRKNHRGETRGEVRLLVKKEELLASSHYNQWKGTIPDYSILARDVRGRETIIGGVALQPEARYVGPGDQPWLRYFEELWNKAQRFPTCFTPVVDIVLNNRVAIVSELARRNELLEKKETVTQFRQELETWLDRFSQPEQPNGSTR